MLLGLAFRAAQQAVMPRPSPVQDSPHGSASLRYRAQLPAVGRSHSPFHCRRDRGPAPDTGQGRTCPTVTYGKVGRGLGDGLQCVIVFLPQSPAAY